MPMWTKAQSREAQKEGWDLFRVTGYYIIQRLDESNKFLDDLSALVYVKGKEYQGDLYHDALRLHGAHAPPDVMGTTQEAFAMTIGKDNEDTIEVKVKTIRVLCDMAVRLSSIERAVNETPTDQCILDELEQWGD